MELSAGQGVADGPAPATGSAAPPDDAPGPGTVDDAPVDDAPVDDAPVGDQPDEDVPPALRAVLVRAAAQTLGELEQTLVPASLRQVARFAPRKRATSGAGPLWRALQDPSFRGRVARTWQQGTGDADEDATEASLAAAAGAWLVGRDWRPLLPTEGPARAALLDQVERARAQAAQARAEVEHARAATAAAEDELAGAQREMRRLRSDADRARSEGRRALEEATATLAEATRLREEAAAALEAADDARRTADAERTAARAELRVARKLADARVRLLLDTIVDAASGLRTELALPPAGELPADLVVPEQAPVPVRAGSRGRSADDPALLDELLRLPWAHLVVDGYNVSKTGYGELSLADQRRVLVDRLGLLAARTGAEVTCCFDGQEGVQVAPPAVRGVRVRFSVGEIADDLIRRIVHAEPPGRAVLVVTSDQQVARDVEAHGARVVPAATLVARLQHL